MKLPKKILTKRLLLRPPCLEDAEEIYNKYARDPKVLKYLSFKAHGSIKVTKLFLKQVIKNNKTGRSLTWAIVDRETKEYMGMIGAVIDGFKAEVSFVMAGPYQSKGYMTEALKSLIRIIFRNRNLYRIWGTCDIDNKASAGVMKKCGMKYEGIFKRWFVNPNISKKPRDDKVFSVTR